MSKKNLNQQANTVTIHADVIELKRYLGEKLAILHSSPENSDYEIYVSAYDADGYVVGGYGSLETAMDCKPNHRYEIKLIKKK